MKQSRERWAIGALLLWYLLLFWAGSSEARPGMDAMTYGALAKHVLATGDWKVLHYSEQSYAEFFQHPPLAIWMSALVFGAWGATDLTQKILPSLLALATLGLVYAWVRRARGQTAAFLAGFILLTSTRFLKYSSSFMLDPFLAAFLLASIVSAWMAFTGRARSWSWWLGSGICGALASLSKGMPALAVFPIVGSLLVGDAALMGSAFARTLARGTFPVLLGFAAPMLAWFAFADGWTYLERYWTESVSGRLGGGSTSSHFGPALGLLKSYWPWLPFLLLAMIRSFRNLLRETFSDWIGRPENVSSLAVLLILGGFSASGHFLEQYLVPVFPFAAVVVAIHLQAWCARYVPMMARTLLGIGTFTAAAVSIFPVHLHGNAYLEPERELLKEAAAAFSSGNTDAAGEVRRIAISSSVADRWRATALGAWYTPWDVWAGSASTSPEENGAQLLLATEGENTGAGWKPTSFLHGKLQIFELAEH